MRASHEGILFVGLVHPCEITGALTTELLELYERRFDGEAAFVKIEYRQPKRHEDALEWLPDRDGAITMMAPRWHQGTIAPEAIKKN